MSELIRWRADGSAGLGILGLGLSSADRASAGAGQDERRATFGAFVQDLWPAARARGVSRATFDEAFRGVEPDAKIIALTQASNPNSSARSGSTSTARSRPSGSTRGRKMAAEWSQTLAAVERTYGVPKEVVLGVWGMETNFGSFTGSIYVVRALVDARLYGLSRRVLPGGAAHRAPDPRGGPYRPRQDAGLLGRRHGPDPVHAVELHEIRGRRQPRRACATSGARCRTPSPRPPIICGRMAGSPDFPWGFEVELPQGFDFRHLRQGFAKWASTRRQAGRRQGAFRAQARRRFSCRAARAVRRSSSPTITT